MISQETLSTAVERGVVSAEQALQLRRLEDARTAGGAEPEDDEKLRFIAGFSDVFVTLGIGLFLGAATYFLAMIGGPVLMSAGTAGLAWLLAEFFTARRRMALPSIVLLIAFAMAVFGAASTLLGESSSAPHILWHHPSVDSHYGHGAFAFAMAGLVTAAAVGLHYKRFGVPITIAAGVAALGITVVSLLAGLAPDFARQWLKVILFGLGLGAFALAMRFDTSDPERATRRTDIAFWLHLLAAPLIVHPLVAGLSSQTPSLSIVDAVAILAIFLVLGAVAVLIDRRALLVSGLIYAGTAFAALLRETGISDATVPATLLVLGAFVLLLSAGWRPLRMAMTRLLPTHIARCLPHPMSSISQ